MSRLLQALKNLEARSPKPAAGKGLLTHLADKYRPPAPDPPPPVSQIPANKPSPIELQPLDNPLAYLSAGLPTIVLPASAASDASQFVESSFAPVFVEEYSSALPRDEVLEPPRDVAELEPIDAPELREPANEPCVLPPVEVAAAAVPARLPTLLERTVRRTLADPQRAEPFRQLADRLWHDLEQVGGRSILLAGIGPASETHEVVLHAAALLAERGEPILVLDADTAHRALTCQLDLAAGTGLAESLRSESDPLSQVQATSFPQLSIFPAGRGRLPDPASVLHRLSQLLETLESQYRLVLIDAGQTSELAAATLARLCDATYFVVRLGETEATQAQAALRDFRAAGARVLGSIATS
ncbi:MAG: hypothetical protein WD872_01025 [Pirellulaceae bacterium]